MGEQAQIVKPKKPKRDNRSFDQQLRDALNEAAAEFIADIRKDIPAAGRQGFNVLRMVAADAMNESARVTAAVKLCEIGGILGPARSQKVEHTGTIDHRHAVVILPRREMPTKVSAPLKTVEMVETDGEEEQG